MCLPRVNPSPRAWTTRSSVRIPPRRWEADIVRPPLPDPRIIGDVRGLCELLGLRRGAPLREGSFLDATDEPRLVRHVGVDVPRMLGGEPPLQVRVGGRVLGMLTEPVTE